MGSFVMQGCGAVPFDDSTFVINDSGALGLINNATPVLNEQSQSTTEAYSAGYVENNFVRQSVLSNLWWDKVSSSGALLVDTQPTPSDDNVITVDTTNTVFDFSHPDIELTRIAKQEIVINPNAQMQINLRMSFSRDCTMEYGVAIQGANSEVLASSQSFGSQEYTANNVTGTTLNVVFNNITEPVVIPQGYNFSVFIYCRQDNATALSADYYAGTTLNNANYYCWNQWALSQSASSTVSTAKLILGATGWDNQKHQVVECTNAQVSSVVLVVPDPASLAEYNTSGIQLIKQANGFLGFTYTETNAPTDDLNISVVIVN